MDKAERAGLSVAVTGHVVLFGALSLGWMAVTKPSVITSTPVDIEIVDRVAEKDQAPDATLAEPAPSVAPEVGPPLEAAPPEPAPPVLTPVLKLDVAKPVPRSAPRPAAAPAVVKPAAAKPQPQPATARPATPKPQPRRSRLGANFLKGIAERPTAGTATTPRAAVGVIATNSISRLVREQLKPYWHPPTGADAELLRTELSVTLSSEGQVTGVQVLSTTGQTDSNRGQVRLHQEAAIKAVRLAAPFSLPQEQYKDWKLLEPLGFDKGLGR